MSILQKLLGTYVDAEFEGTNEKNNCRCVIIVMFILTLLFIGLLAMLWYGNQINPDTVKVKPHQFMKGTEVKEIETISIEDAYLLHSEKISLFTLLVDSSINIISSTNRQLKMIDEYMGILEDIDSQVVKEQTDMKELEIPIHSVYSGTKGLVINEKSIDNVLEILGLNRLWFSTEMHIYAWQKEYKLINKTDIVENHYVLLYCDKFIYLRTQSVGSKKGTIELFGGKYKINDY